MRILFLGDTHGNIGQWYYATQIAEDYSCAAIIQVGDFGFWTHTEFGVKYLNELNNLLLYFNLPCFFIDGNHENHVDLNAIPVINGVRNIRDCIFHIPRGSLMELGGRKILGIGGAYSIDRASRTEGRSWWPEEMITDADITTALSVDQPDIVVSHDCPSVVPYTLFLNHFPAGPTLSQRDKLNLVYEKFRPKLWIHGHYHRSYRHMEDQTRFVGLDCDMTGSKSWVVVELDDLTL